MSEKFGFVGLLLNCLPPGGQARLASGLPALLDQGLIRQGSLIAQAAVGPLFVVLAAAAFLFGLAVEELRPEELDYQDPDYELLIAVRAVKK